MLKKFLILRAHISPQRGLSKNIALEILIRMDPFYFLRTGLRRRIAVFVEKSLVLCENNPYFYKMVGGFFTMAVKKKFSAALHMLAPYLKAEDLKRAELIITETNHVDSIKIYVEKTGQFSNLPVHKYTPEIMEYYKKTIGTDIENIKRFLHYCGHRDLINIRLIYENIGDEHFFKNVQHLNIPIMKMLRNMGADLKAWEYHLFKLFLDYEKLDCIKWLLKQGCSLECRWLFPVFINIKDKDTFVFCAKNSYTFMEMLRTEDIQHGYNVKALKVLKKTLWVGYYLDKAANAVLWVLKKISFLG
jgi:hypothetical protein